MKATDIGIKKNPKIKELPAGEYNDMLQTAQMEICNFIVHYFTTDDMFIQRLESLYFNKTTPQERQYYFIEDFYGKLKPQEKLVNGLEYKNAEMAV